MTTISQPVANIIKTSAEQIISNAPQRVLTVGQGLGSSFVSGELVKDIGNNDSDIDIFGKGSQLHEMLRGFKKINQVTAIDAIGLDDAGAMTKATGVVAFTGTATEDGTIEVSIGSEVNHKYTLNIVIGDGTTAIGDKLVAEIALDDFAIVTAIEAGTVGITAKNSGTIGNTIGIGVVCSVVGVSCTVTQMSGGATDPSLVGLFDVVGNKRYQTVVFPGNYDESVLTGFLDPRFNADNEIVDGVGVISKTDTLSLLKTFLNTLNSQSLIVHANEFVSTTERKSPSLFEWDDVIAAQVGALRSLRLTDGSNLSRLVIASNLDLIGGTAISSLPYFNTPVFDLPLIDTGLGFTNIEIDEINTAGGFVIGNNVTRTTVLLGEMFTTSKTDVAGNPDKTFQFLNSVDVLSNIAEFFFNNIRADFAQSRLTDGNVTPGRNDANENTIRSKFVDYYQTLSNADFMLTRSGRDNLKFFVDNLTFTLDLLEGKVTSIAQVPLVVQLREITVILQAVFNIQAN